jgi:hypothetical protein
MSTIVDDVFLIMTGCGRAKKTQCSAIGPFWSQRASGWRFICGGLFYVNNYLAFENAGRGYFVLHFRETLLSFSPWPALRTSRISQANQDKRPSDSASFGCPIHENWWWAGGHLLLTRVALFDATSAH